MDRTLLPNGPQEESAEARPRLRRLAAREDVVLAYVSGRSRELMIEAIREYDLPTPRYAVGDVGTTVYRVRDGWKSWAAWEQAIAPDWNGKTAAELAGLLAPIPGLRKQEPDKQSRYKLSFYAPEDTDSERLLKTVRQSLEEHRIRAGLIWSVDEAAHMGLLDILPEHGNKLHAVEFLIEQGGFDRSRCVFAGDSGNDLAVLASSIQSVLVRNAGDDVREKAKEEAAASGLSDKLYLAQGGFLGMNGNYAAGVLEGLAHYLPETKGWMTG